ncbi:MAG: BREX system ATP-binding domain-containing protein [Sphaerochaetaceae bacterium]
MEPQNPLFLLSNGKAPEDASILTRLSPRSSFVLNFWEKQYLSSFIKDGGSKIKFLTGRAGCGKTHTLMLAIETAKRNGYLVARLNAGDTALYTFQEWFKAIYHCINLQDLVTRCGEKIIKTLGFNPKDVENETTFMDYLCNKNEGDSLTLRQLRTELRKAFLDNPHMDNNFAQVISMLTGAYLGYPQLDDKSKAIILGWLEGDTTIKLNQLRGLGMSPYRITKYNARHMLRSLIEMIVFAGYSGLFITVDDLESVLGSSSMTPIHYTKMRRDDTFESIRELIDDIDSFHHVMFVFAGRKVLFDDEDHGIRSYQALWMRIQNEVVSDRINGFSDIIDLDKVERQTFTPEILVEISQRLVAVLHDMDTKALAIDLETAKTLLAKADNGDISIPRLVNQATLGKLQDKLQEVDHV